MSEDRLDKLENNLNTLISKIDQLITKFDYNEKEVQSAKDASELNESRIQVMEVQMAKEEGERIRLADKLEQQSKEIKEIKDSKKSLISQVLTVVGSIIAALFISGFN